MILDTNALSALAGGDPSLQAIVEGERLLALPVVVLGEYRFGISQSQKRTQHEAWLNELLSHVRILTIDQETTLPYRDIRCELRRAGRPIPSNDTWIAALCRQHSLPLLSRDKHFDVVSGIKRIAW